MDNTPTENTDGDMTLELWKCSEHLSRSGKPSPRTCQLCELGPCRYYDKSPHLDQTLAEIQDPQMKAAHGVAQELFKTFQDCQTQPRYQDLTWNAGIAAAEQFYLSVISQYEKAVREQTLAMPGGGIKERRALIEQKRRIFVATLAERLGVSIKFTGLELG